MEDQETLQTTTVIGKLANTVQNGIDKFLTNSVMATSVVVSSIFLTSNQLLRMEELTISASTNFVNNSRFQIDKDSTRNVFTSASFTKESSKGMVLGFLFSRDATIRIDAVFHTIQFPTGITNLNTGLTNVNTDDFSHFLILL
ncbi:hypothetical protein BDC45DRAFT_518663 [Circinella umbellata]|nr:hypothetical protein BDC45DRAFT_518663 [Circinella umbellata]